MTIENAITGMFGCTPNRKRVPILLLHWKDSFFIIFLSPSQSAIFHPRSKTPILNSQKPKTHIHFPFSTSPQTRINTPKIPGTSKRNPKTEKGSIFLAFIPQNTSSNTTAYKTNLTKSLQRKDITTPWWLHDYPKPHEPHHLGKPVNIPKPRGQNRQSPCIPCSGEQLLCWVQCPSLQCRGLWNSRPF